MTADDLLTRVAVALHGVTPPDPEGALALHRDAAARVVAALGLDRGAWNYLAPDGDGDLTIWRERGDRDPLAVMTWTQATHEAFTLAARGLEVRS